MFDHVNIMYKSRYTGYENRSDSLMLFYDYIVYLHSNNKKIEEREIYNENNHTKLYIVKNNFSFGSNRFDPSYYYLSPTNDIRS